MSNCPQDTYVPDPPECFTPAPLPTPPAIAQTGLSDQVLANLTYIGTIGFIALVVGTLTIMLIQHFTTPKEERQ